ncbi:MAG: hypothetical protein WBW48_02095 [Anaerolineae bacterium]
MSEMITFSRLSEAGDHGIQIFRRLLWHNDIDTSRSQVVSELPDIHAGYLGGPAESNFVFEI